MIFPFLYFTPKSFLPLSHPNADMSWSILPLIVVRMFFRCFGMSCFVYCLVLFQYLFSLPSFTSTFWFVTSCCIFPSSCRDFSASSEYVFMFGFIIFACCPSFLISDSNLSSHSGFNCVGSPEGPPFFHRLILLLHILNPLIT